jgi:hypothetical protein
MPPDDGEMAVVMYVPILKARMGEFLALGKAGPNVIGAIRPLLEVMRGASGSLYGSVIDFGDRLMAAAPKGMIFAVDCRYLRSARSEIDDGPLSLVASDTHDRGICMLPVFSPGGDQDPGDVRRAAALHQAGGCLRLGPQYLTQAVGDDRGDLVPQLLDATGLAPAEVDLVIDLGEVCTHAARERAARLGHAALPWARRHSWRSVTVAAGAFPSNIGDLPLGTSTAVPRWDAVLWSALAAPGIGQEGIGYGDYAVSNPRLLDGRSPLPNLRYASKRHWHVYRYPKTATGAFSTFHDLCQAVISSGHWPELGGEFSWGDQQIEDTARRHGGPGNATLWRAFGTSHHLAVVVDRLERIGEP